MVNSAFIVFVMSFIFVIAAVTASATDVSVKPGYLDTARFGTVTGSIYMKSAQAVECDISMSGVPQEWLDYPDSVDVEGERTASFVVNPRSTGKYTLLTLVDCGNESFDFETRLWVGFKGAGVPNDYVYRPEGPTLGGDGTGMFALGDQDTLLAAYAVIVVGAVVALLLGHMMLKEEES